MRRECTCNAQGTTRKLVWESSPRAEQRLETEGQGGDSAGSYKSHGLWATVKDI